jgi:hypothetical protein
LSNRNLGKQGEELVYIREQHELRAADRDDLARKVQWTSVVRGDGAGYDIPPLSAIPCAALQFLKR